MNTGMFCLYVYAGICIVCSAANPGSQKTPALFWLTVADTVVLFTLLACSHAWRFTW
jgi:hypothetical protein